MPHLVKIFHSLVPGVKGKQSPNVWTGEEFLIGMQSSKATCYLELPLSEEPCSGVP